MYHLMLQACTGGGCRMSAPSVAVTAESAPEGVPLPNITATSSSQLLVTWDAPTSPNGKRYKMSPIVQGNLHALFEL